MMSQPIGCRRQRWWSGEFSPRLFSTPTVREEEAPFVFTRPCLHTLGSCGGALYRLARTCGSVAAATGPNSAPPDRGYGLASNTCFGVTGGSDKDVAKSGSRGRGSGQWGARAFLKETDFAAANTEREIK
ncbi:hypothetical protein MRX96_042265 [Rhipicephalus microplus]